MRISLLFMPGNNPAMLQNADVFESDSVIIDLEDAVAVTEKDAARVLVGNFLKNFRLNLNEVVVRINGLDTEYYEKDLKEIVSDSIDTIMLPKATVEYLKQLDVLLTALEKERGMKKHLKVLPIVELAVSLMEVDEMVRLPRVDGVLLGAEDFTRDMEVQRTAEGDEIFYARAKIATACKAYKIDAIDTPFTATNDTEGLIRDCVRSKGLGMSAKACIHPNQVDTVNKQFAPSEKEIQFAERVMAALEDAKKQGKGAFSLDGKMVDKPIIERAETTLKKAKIFGMI